MPTCAHVSTLITALASTFLLSQAIAQSPPRQGAAAAPTTPDEEPTAPTLDALKQNFAAEHPWPRPATAH